MSLILRQSISPSAEFGLLEISSLPVSDLVENLITDPKEKSEILSLKNEIRIKEILGTKSLIRELLGKEAQLFYDANGKPHLINSDLHISFSHSCDYIAAIVEKNHSTGIDIQKITPKILRIKEKFLSKRELDEIDEKPDLLEILHVLWGAKECMFKEHGEGNIIFSEQMYVFPFDYNNNGEIRASLKIKNKIKSFNLDYKKINSYMLVYVRELANIVT